MRNKNVKNILIILLIIFTIFIHYMAKSPYIKDTGGITTSFSFENMNGQKISLDDYKGKKSVILYFWRSDLTLCQKGIGDLIEFYNKNRDKVEVIYVNEGDMRLEVEKFQEKHNWKDLNISMDATGQLAMNYGIDKPTLLLLDKNGREIYRYPHNTGKPELKDILDTTILPLMEK